MLVQRRVGLVINASPSISGRYPNTGPSILLEAGIPILDDAGKEIMTVLSEDDEICVQGAEIQRHGEKVGEGTPLTKELMISKMEASRSNLANELEKFAQNTLKFIQEEKSLILDPVDVPDVRTVFSGRHALIVVRGEGFREDLAIIKSYLQEMRPVLIGVDGGADALLDYGFKPDLVVGDMDSVTDEALMCGAEIVVHAYGNGDHKAPGLDRIKALGLEAKVFPVQGTSEDMAMLLAYEKGAELLVAVGSHSNLIDFLDKGRAGMASTFLTRLKVGPKLVDAKGVSRLYRRAAGGRELLMLCIAAAVPIAVVAFQSPAIKTWLMIIQYKIKRHLGM